MILKEKPEQCDSGRNLFIEITTVFIVEFNNELNNQSL